MLVCGISFILFWGLVQAFKVELLTAALVTGIIMILLGLLLGEANAGWPWKRP